MPYPALHHSHLLAEALKTSPTLLQVFHAALHERYRRERLRRLGAQLSVCLEELVELSGISRSTINRWRDDRSSGFPACQPTADGRVLVIVEDFRHWLREKNIRTRLIKTDPRPYSERRPRSGIPNPPPPAP